MATTDYEIINEESGEVKTNGTAVAVRRQGSQLANREMVAGMLRPVAAPAEILEAQNEVRALVAQTLTAERDYGTIPGTNKPSLLKPGAERINAAFGLAAEYHVAEKEIDHDRPNAYVKRSKVWRNQHHGDKVFTWAEETGQSEGLYRYVVECRLVHRASGVMVGQGIGSCSTMESKYIDRPRDLENTVLKMASKRAYIAATLNTHGLSDQFTQDVEDNPEAFGAGGNSAPASAAAARGPILEQAIGFGKHKGKTWAAVIDEARDYVEWAVENLDKLSQAEKDDLTRALNNSQSEGNPDVEEMDRIATATRLMITDMRRLDEPRGKQIEAYYEDKVSDPAITLSGLRTLQDRVKDELDKVKDAAPVPTLHDGPDGLPF